MATHRKPLERRTYSEDRYYALIKRQKSGKATFKELTELDEIVNRVPDIREKVIRESFMIDETQDTNEPTDDAETEDNISSLHRQSLWSRIRSFILRVFTIQLFAEKAQNPLEIRAV